ncbi:MAG TPA: hypothetical protein VJR89_41055 [Polyangiales bacterium]|nr:hypothetical protein [Polyangiales bacterium]
MKTLALCSTLLASIAYSTTAIAGGLPAWDNHAQLCFLFGNDFDSHQQSQLRDNGDLAGALYIHYTGVVTADGLRVASHADCNRVSDCSVGWTMTGKPREAAFLYHAMDDHPVFLIDRSQIPQPGAYAHFHRVAGDEHSSGAGYMLQLFAVQRFCFLHHDAAAAEAGKSCLENGGIAVNPGVDIATHVNVVTSVPTAM